MGEMVPDALAFAVFLPGAFNLIGCGGCPPDEILWKMKRFHDAPFLNDFC
jgi:hypothetical protein